METIKYKGYTITIEQDEYDNPREWDNFGHMVCAHRRYDIGDEQLEVHGVSLEDDLKHNLESIGLKLNDVLILPLYLYDHSGIAMNTTGFSCGWDSGQVGFIYVSKEDVRKEYNVKRITKTIKEKTFELLRGEVATYSQYLDGDVWCVRITDEEDEAIDSCCGLYGYDYAKESAFETIDIFIKE